MQVFFSFQHTGWPGSSGPFSDLCTTISLCSGHPKFDFPQNCPRRNHRNEKCPGTTSMTNNQIFHIAHRRATTRKTSVVSNPKCLQVCCVRFGALRRKTRRHRKERRPPKAWATRRSPRRLECRCRQRSGRWLRRNTCQTTAWHSTQTQTTPQTQTTHVPYQNGLPDPQKCHGPFLTSPKPETAPQADFLNVPQMVENTRYK